MLHGNGIGNGYAASVVERVAQRTPPTSIDRRLLDMDEVAQAVLEAEGDLALVAERLLGDKRKQDELLSYLSSDPQTFGAFGIKARTFVMIKLIQCFAVLNKAVIANVHELEPKEAAKALFKSAEMIALLSKNDTSINVQNTQVNVYDAVMRTAPPQISAILNKLIQNGVNPADVITQHNTPLELDSPSDVENDS